MDFLSLQNDDQFRKLPKRFKIIKYRNYENSGIYKLINVNHFTLYKQANCLK